MEMVEGEGEGEREGRGCCIEVFLVLVMQLPSVYS